MTDLHSAANRVLDISTELLRLYDDNKERTECGGRRGYEGMAAIDAFLKGWKDQWNDLRPALADLRSALQQPQCDVLCPPRRSLVDSHPEIYAGRCLQCEVNKLNGEGI